jgi:hypothetical protein
LHKLELDKLEVDDEEELLVHLPSWGAAEENPDIDVAGMKGDGVDVHVFTEVTKTWTKYYTIRYLLWVRVSALSLCAVTVSPTGDTVLYTQ